jgi:hypothetical protein
VPGARLLFIHSKMCVACSDSFCLLEISALRCKIITIFHAFVIVSTLQVDVGQGREVLP